MHQTSGQMLSHEMGEWTKDAHVHIYIFTKTPRPGMLRFLSFLVKSVMRLAELKSLRCRYSLGLFAAYTLNSNLCNVTNLSAFSQPSYHHGLRSRTKISTGRQISFRPGVCMIPDQWNIIFTDDTHSHTLPRFLSQTLRPSFPSFQRSLI